MKRLMLALACGAMLTMPAAAQADYISEIVILATNFCPASMMPADGRLLPIMQYQALFALLGTTYGGNGETNFALPNLTGQTMGPAHQKLTWCIVTQGTGLTRADAKPPKSP
ncbi:MAG: tail fiber protein [Rhizomicrobium sp.]